MEPLRSLEPSQFEIAVIWQLAFIGVALAQLNKKKLINLLGLGPFIIALWILFL